MLKKFLRFQFFLAAVTITLLIIQPIFTSAEDLESTILDAAWSPDGTMLATITDKGTLEVIVPSQNTIIFQFTRTVPDLVKATVSWNPLGDRLTAGIGNRMSVWEAPSWQLLYDYGVGAPSGFFFDSDLGDNNPEGVQNITWSLDGRYIVVGTYSYEISVWDMQEEELIFRDLGISGGGPGGVWLGDGWLGDGFAKLNIFSGQEIFPTVEDIQNRFGGSIVTSTEPRPDNTQMAWGDIFGYLAIYDINTLQGIIAIEVTDSIPPSSRRRIADIAWNSTWNFIAVVSRDGELYITNLISSEVETVLNVTGELYAVDWNPISNEIIYSGVSGTGQPILEIVDVTGFAGVPPMPSITLTQSNATTIVSESSATDTYTLALGTQPTADVVVSVAGMDQITVSPATLTFTPENWNVPQTVTITAVDDSVVEGNHTAVITHSVVSADAGYNGLTVSDITVSIEDNDTAAVTVTQLGGSTAVTEGGATDTYTVVLTSQPTSNVVITASASSQATMSPSTLTFTPSNWNTPQTVTVTAVDDSVVEGVHTATISHSISSSDAMYAALTAPSAIVVNITDNDTATVTVTQSGGSTDVIEGGATDSYTVVLTSQPTSNVVITTSASGQATVSPSTLTFTTSNWNTPQTVTVTALDDSVIEWVHTAVITHTAVSVDTGYNGMAVAGVTVNITDNDVPGVGWLAFVSNRPIITDGQNVWNIYTVADNGDLVRLTDNSNTLRTIKQPVWSPDYLKIAYSSTIGGDEDLCILTVSTRQEQCEGFYINTLSDTDNGQPAWSPDGLWLAYVTRQGTGEDDIFKITVADLYAGNGRGTNLTPGANGSNTQPDWRYDGNWIVFSSNRVISGNPEGNSEVFIMSSSGSNTQQMTATGVNVDNNLPAWSPNGQRIAYNSDYQQDAKHDVVHRKVLLSGTTWSWDSNLVNLTENRAGSYRFTAWKKSDGGTNIIAVVRGEGDAREIFTVKLLNPPVFTAPGWNSTLAEDDPDW